MSEPKAEINFNVEINKKILCLHGGGQSAL